LLRFVQVFINRIDEINQIEDTGFHVNTGTHTRGQIDFAFVGRYRAIGNLFTDPVRYLNSEYPPNA
jgi:hypothetical protein